MIIHDEGVLLTHDGVLVFWRRAARRPTRVARPRDSSRWTDTPPESNEVPVSTTGLPGHYTSQRLLRRLFHFAWWMTFESPHYPPKWACCLSAMTYRSLCQNGRWVVREPRRRRSGMLPVTVRCWFMILSRQRLGLFSMPPAATVEADVLKNCGSCHEVNTGLSTKATLALLAAFKVFGVFLSHKDQRLEVLNRFVYQFQPTSLCDCITA